MNSTAENEISITVKVKDQTAAGMAAVKEEVKAGGLAAAEEASVAGEKISDGLANGLKRDSQGKIRNALGQFASEAEKEAAGIGGGKGIEVPVTLSGDAFERDFRAAMSEAEQAGANADSALVKSFGDVEKASRTVRSAAGELGTELDGTGTAAERAGTALDGAGKKAENAGSGANNSGNSFAFLHSKVFLLTSAALALGPALAAVPAVMGAAALGAGTMALAFGGVVGALKDYAAQSNSSASSGASAAATAFSNGVAIRNAEQAITDAKKQAAQQAVTSAQAIVSAQQGVADAERAAAQAAQSSADSIVAAQQRVEQATYAVGQAQQAETNADYALEQAQKALTQAQTDAVNVLTDLNNANADAANSVADATNSVADAQHAWDLAKNNSLLTDQQKRDSYQALVDAQQRLTDAQQKAKEAGQAADAANKQGVTGLDSVTQAQHAAEQAAQALAAAQHNTAQSVQAQADAQHALAVAQQNAANSQISSNEQVAKAQQALTQAQKSAADQQAASAEQVSKAVQALADMQTQQALAASAAGASNNKFAQDMGKLTQPARDLVNQVLGMKSGLHELSVTAQNATLPGFTQMLRDSTGLLPTINGGVKGMGSAIGGVAIQFGNLIKSPAFQGQLHDVLKQAADLATQLGNGMVGMVGGITQAASQAGPIVKGLGDGLSTIMSAGIPAFLQGLVTNAGGAGQLFSGLGDIISGLMGPIGTFSGALAGALGPFVTQLSQSLMPLMGPLSQALAAVAQVLGAVLQVLAPLLPIISVALVGALKIVTPLLQSLAKFLGDNQKWLAPIAAGILTWITVQWALNAALTANPIGLLIAGIAALVLGVIYAWEHFQTFRDVVKQIWSDVEAVFDAAVKWIAAIWLAQIKAAQAAWVLIRSYIVDPIVGAYNDVTSWLGKVVDFVTGLPGKLASAGAHMWDWVAQGVSNIAGSVAGGFHSFINELIQGINWAIGYVNGALNSISDAWTWIPGASGSGIPSIPSIPQWRAMGGVASGLTGMGEAGIELVRLPNGSVVMPHANTASAMQSGNGGHSGGPIPQLEWIGPVGDELFTLVKKWIRANYGTGPNSVQLALGQRG